MAAVLSHELTHFLDYTKGNMMDSPEDVLHT